MKNKIILFLLLILISSMSKAQIIIRIHNQSKKNIPVYVTPIKGKFFFTNKQLKKINSKNYYFKMLSNHVDDIVASTNAEDQKTADVKVYIGGNTQKNSCFFRLKFSMNIDNKYAYISCEKNFITEGCYNRYLISFTYVKNIMDITVYNKKSTKYANDGACPSGF